MTTIEYEGELVVEDEQFGPPPDTGQLELSRVVKLASVVSRYDAGEYAKARKAGEYFVAQEPNSFGIPSVDTCPGRTDYCEKDCYAIDSERRTATHEKLVRNFAVLQGSESVDDMTELLDSMIASYMSEADRLKVAEAERFFRIHWSGDFFSEDYGQAWRNVINNFPQLNFFVFTRSFRSNVNVLPILSGLENLDLFTSVDQENIDDAIATIDDYPDVRVAYLVDYYEDAKNLRTRLGRTDGYFAKACPENMLDSSGEHRFPVINKEGGACSRCRYCMGGEDNTQDVVFVKKGRSLRRQLTILEPDSVPINLSERRKRRQSIGLATGSLTVAHVADSLF